LELQEYEANKKKRISGMVTTYSFDRDMPSIANDNDLLVMATELATPCTATRDRTNDNKEQ